MRRVIIVPRIMQPPDAPSQWRGKHSIPELFEGTVQLYDGHDQWKPAVDKLFAALKSEFSCASAMIDRLRDENGFLREKLGVMDLTEGTSSTKADDMDSNLDSCYKVCMSQRKDTIVHPVVPKSAPGSAARPETSDWQIQLEPIPPPKAITSNRIALGSSVPPVAEEWQVPSDDSPWLKVAPPLAATSSARPETTGWQVRINECPWSTLYDNTSVGDCVVLDGSMPVSLPRMPITTPGRSDYGLLSDNSRAAPVSVGCVGALEAELGPNMSDASSMNMDRVQSTDTPLDQCRSKLIAECCALRELREQEEQKPWKELSDGSEMSMLDMWRIDEVPKAAKRVPSRSATLHMGRLTRSDGHIPQMLSAAESEFAEHEDVRTGDVLEEVAILQPFMMNPTCRACLAWDVLIVLATIYDLIVIPLQVFSVTDSFFFYLDIVTALIWSLDMAMTLLRGIDLGGVIDLRPSVVVPAYMQSWFAVDITLATVDWIIIARVTDAQLDLIRIVRLRRSLAIVRMMGLLRILRLRTRRKSTLASHHVSAVLSVVKFLVVLWFINHYTACGWYAVGKCGLEPNWVERAFEDHHGLSYRYMTSYHWSLTQFTPASMEVVPMNAFERVYAMVAIFFGLVMFTTFVSHMTNGVKTLQELNADIDKQRTDLRHYFSQHHVSYNLGKTIAGFVHTESKRIRSKRLLESDIKAFRILPDNLINRLRAEVYSPVLSVHPFFSQVQEAEPGAFRSICNLASNEKNVLVGEELFRFGQNAAKMYFATSGELAYFKGFHGESAAIVREGSWFSECALWCKWTHKGRMMSSYDVAELVCLDVAEFHTIIAATSSFFEVRRYARIYCWKAVDHCGSRHEVDDIWGGPQQVAGAARQAWRPSPLHIVNNLAMWLWQGTEEWWLITFRAWKDHTARALVEKMKGQSVFGRWFRPVRGRSIKSPQRRVNLSRSFSKL